MRYRRRCRVKRGMSSPSRCWRLMPGVGDRGLDGSAPLSPDFLQRIDANLSVRLASALIKLGTGTRTEAIAGASAILNDAPRASTRLETEVLEYLEAWQCAERGQVRQAVRILELDPGRRDAGFDRSSNGSSVRVAPAARRVPLRRRSAGRRRSDTRRVSSVELLPKGAARGTRNSRLGSGCRGRLRSARDHLDRAAALTDRESAAGAPDPGATLWSARQWLEMETGGQIEAPPDPLVTSHAICVSAPDQPCLGHHYRRAAAADSRQRLAGMRFDAR